MNYIDITRAEELANEQLNTEPWDDAMAEDGSIAGQVGSQTYKALTMATNIIDQLNYKGLKTVSTQVNQFPRGGDTEVPLNIEKATFEIAIALLDGVDPNEEMSTIGVINQGYANVRQTVDPEMPAPYVSAGVPSAVAWKYLIPYLRLDRSVETFRAN